MQKSSARIIQKVPQSESKMKHPRKQTDFSTDMATHWGNLWDEQSKTSFDEWKADPLNQYKFKHIFEPILIKLPKNAKILEVGCGLGSWLIWMRQYRPDLQLFGLDISKKAIGFCRKVGIDARLGSQQDMPFEEKMFDYVISIGVVEHYHDTQDTIRAIHEHIRVTKTFCYIDVPNKHSLPALEFEVGNVLFKNFTADRRIIEVGRFYTCRQLAKWANSNPHANITVVSKRFAQILPMYKYIKKIDLALPSFIRNSIGSGAGIIIERKSEKNYPPLRKNVLKHKK